MIDQVFNIITVLYTLFQFAVFLLVSAYVMAGIDYLRRQYVYVRAYLVIRGVIRRTKNEDTKGALRIVNNMIWGFIKSEPFFNFG